MTLHPNVYAKPQVNENIENNFYRLIIQKFFKRKKINNTIKERPKPKTLEATLYNKKNITNLMWIGHFGLILNRIDIYLLPK